jgi:hypothetical protein
MHIHKLFLIIAAGATTVLAECYVPKWGTYGNTDEKADEAVNNFCESGLAGYFTNGQTKYRCAWLQENVKADIEVKWMGSGDLTLNTEDCKLRLRNEFYGCSVGGHSVVADWYFR